MRWDQLLAKLWPELSRSRIHELLEAGVVEYQGPHGEWLPIRKAGARYNGSHLKPEQVRLLDSDLVRYVSRGALKLRAALDQFSVPVEGFVCLDVGLSTGGFSDLLLQRGAQKVLGLDVGQGQVHAKLRDDPRLIWRDKVNARDPIPTDLLDQVFADRPPLFDLIVVDVSFISLSLILENLIGYVDPMGWLVLLVKPQFELQARALNKKGVVKDPADNQAALAKIIQVCKDLKLDIIGTCPSPIEGENGNQEQLLVARPQRLSSDFNRM